MSVIASHFKLMLLAVMMLTLFKTSFVQAIDCENYIGTIPRNAHQLSKKFEKIQSPGDVNYFMMGHFNYQDVSAVSNAFSQDPNNLYIDITPGNKDRIIHILTTISRDQPPYFALVKVKAKQKCMVRFKGGDVTDIYLYD